MTEIHKGILAMGAACVIWGVSPIFFKALNHVDASVVLAHRTIWACVFFWLILVLQRRARAVPQLLRSQPLTVLASAAMISVNWFVFIRSVHVGKAMQASLGYYIFPLVAVLLGAIVFGERLRAVQWVAVGLAVAAVSVLTLGLGVVPVVSLILATTFGIYGVLKKRLEAGPLVSVTAETAMVAPIGLLWLLWLSGSGDGPRYDPWTLALLVLSGPVMTALPLMLFTYATRRVRLATIGLVQYLNPTLQFFCAVVIFGEAFTPWHAAAFGLIWTALALYSGQALADDRASRKRAISASTSGMV